MFCEQPCDCRATCKRDDLIGRFVTYFTVPDLTVPDSENARCLSGWVQMSFRTRNLVAPVARTRHHGKIKKLRRLRP